MATEEYLARYMEQGKRYEELPPRFRLMTSEDEWRKKVKDYCIHKGLTWVGTVATTVIHEHDYYEELIKFYRTNKRLFPYQLAEYICRMMRITPFRYYINILYDAMKEDRPYDSIPNFTAADIVRIMGIGRNEYIATMVQAKSKKLLWRVNKGIVKDLLPQEPLDIPIDPWWVIHVVNVGEAEFRQLSPEELQVCHLAARPGGARAGDTHMPAVRQLYRKGLVWLDVPVRPEDHLSIPPLEGFVSNKTMAAGASDTDPLESLLYQIFVAASDRVTVAKLASILNVDVPALRVAISMACRLRFCRRLDPAAADDLPSPSAASVTSAMDHLDLDSLLKQEATGIDLDSDLAETGGGGSEGTGVAFVVDAEVTGYLMMGALTPNCKKHSVTLFEGGRVYGADVISELIFELHASVGMSEGFEGEMKALVNYARSLAIVLEAISACAGGRPIELLRKESMASLPPASAFRILSHSYGTILPITTLPFPPLPLTLQRAAPVNYGPTPAACTPWMHLALYQACGAGPTSLALVCGQQFTRLPPQLQRCHHALLWPWDAAAVKAQSVPVVVEGPHLLYLLNRYLTHTAILVQPLHQRLADRGAGGERGRRPGSRRRYRIPRYSPPWMLPCPCRWRSRRLSGGGDVPQQEGGGAGSSEGAGEGWAGGGDWADFEVASSRSSSPSPLPLAPSLTEQVPAGPPAELLQQQPAAPSAAGPDQQDVQVPAFDGAGSKTTVQLPGGVLGAIAALGIGTALGHLRMLQGPGGELLPLQLCLGMPMQPTALCQAVCDNARGVQFLDPATRRKHQEGQQVMQRALYQIISKHGACSSSFVGSARESDLSSFVDTPVQNLIFQAGTTSVLECRHQQQGARVL